MRRALGFVGGILAAVALALLMAPTGGFPSRPRFQAVGVGQAAPATAGNVAVTGTLTAEGSGTFQNFVASSTSPRLCFDDTDAATDERGYWISNASGLFRIFASPDSGTCSTVSATTPFQISRTGTTIDSIALTATAITGNGIALTPESGSFVVTFETACTTSPTATFDYQKVGNTVTLALVSVAGFVCTSDSTSFSTTGTPVPASIRPSAYPSAASTTPIHGFTDNGAATWASIVIFNTGGVSFARCATFGADCNVSGWTASGNKSVAAGKTVTYMLGNP